jgi:hypothetical protein
MADDEVHWQQTESGHCLVLRPQGTLNAITYRRFSDSLVKFAMDLPSAVVVDVADLGIADEPLLTAFSSAWMRVSDWPGVPIMLVVESADRRARFEASAIRRFVPVFASVPDAVAAAEAPPSRRLARVDLMPIGESSRHARRFVRDVCTRWDVPEVILDAQVVATELVENALAHTYGDLRLRLELRAELLTVAVGDDDPHEAVLREPGAGQERYRGLLVVAQLATTWGCVPQRSGGKVVWATLPVGHRRSIGRRTRAGS